MFGSSYVGWQALAVTCDSLAKTLDAGVDVRRSFALAADKTRDARCRDALRNVVDDIKRGDDVASSMEQQGVFPPLVTDMVSVAESTGMLPEIFEHLRDHYEANLKLRRSFLGQITLPVLQFVAGTLVIALVLVVLGWITETNGAGGLAFDPFGFGLMGTSGAMIWLGTVYGGLFVLFVGYQVLTRLLSGKAFVHGLLLNVPAVGHCMRSFALARFSWAYYLTQQTGMLARPSLEASLRATDNGAFQAATSRVVAQVEGGDELTRALAVTGLFPRDYLEMVRVGEESGTVPETLHRLRPQLEESARRSLSAMATAFGWTIWILIATFIGFIVIRFVMQYVAFLQELM